MKYSQSERALDHRLAALTAEQDARGLKGLVARVSGRQAKLAGQRETYLQAKVKLQEQKEAEQRIYLERQVTQRTRQRERQAAEHQRFAVRLDAIKARRDEAFELRERDRQARLRTPRTPDRVVAGRSATPLPARSVSGEFAENGGGPVTGATTRAAPSRAAAQRSAPIRSTTRGRTPGRER